MSDLFGGIFDNRKVFITGHTGFKGSWLVLLLNELGADVYGYALEPPTRPSLYNTASVDEFVKSYISDIRDYNKLHQAISEVQPEIMIHMAAQPLVRESYKNPIDTYSTNVMGTVNLLEACRHTKSIRAIVNVTTDKCYENKEWIWGYRENEPMGGFDPYSNSKACSELVTSAFRSSYFNENTYKDHGVAMASARAGNVIGGGDWATDRLIPDFIRSIQKGEELVIRSPYAIRPWQHVLEPLSGYLLLASKLFIEGSKYAGAWNFGPNDSDAVNVEFISKLLCDLWGGNSRYKIDDDPQPHEANYLKLDCSKSRNILNWHPQWDIQTAISSIIDWHKCMDEGKDVRQTTVSQISSYFESKQA